MRRRPDIFGEESIQLIFSNIEQIWQFQQTFLDALRQGVMMDRVAETFLEYVRSSYIFITFKVKKKLIQLFGITAIRLYGLLCVLQYLLQSANGIGYVQR